MSNKHNDDEYFFEDDELDSFSEELDKDKKQKSTTEHESGQNDSENEFDLDNDESDASASFSAASVSERTKKENLATSSHYADEDEENDQAGFIDKAKAFAGKHRRILIIAGVVVVAIIGLKLIFAPTPQQRLLESAPVQPQPAVQQPAPMIQQVAPSVSKEQFSSLSDAVMSNRNSLNALQARLGNVAAKQTDTDDAISQLSTQLQQIQTQNQQLIAQVKLMEKREQDRMEKAEYKKTHYVRYHVQAMESGRAWLMGSDGLATTVAVGNSLPHYGTILSIDVDNGAVVTSSGDTIRYGNQKPNSASTR